MEGGTSQGRQSWDEQGFVVLAQAAPAAAVEQLDRELGAEADRLLVWSPGDDYPSLAARRDARQEAGIVDPYVLSIAARELLMPPAAVAFLADVHGAAPMLVDAVGTEAGAPGASPYRDPTFVPSSDPDALAGMLVALGDATLPVFPGSHRLAPEPFSDRYRHVNPERDGADALDEHRTRLEAALADAGLGERAVELRPGDVLLWQANLVHRGAEGRAMEAHLLPCSAEPQWFAQRPDRAYRVRHGEAWFTSRYYPLADVPGAVRHAAPATSSPADERGTPGLDVVEHELDRHDDVPATPAAPERQRGMLGRVRGVMGRRPPRP